MQYIKTSPQAIIDKQDEQGSNNRSALFAASLTLGGTLFTASQFSSRYKTGNNKYFYFLNQNVETGTFNQFRDSGKYTGGDVIIESLRRFEEYSPAKIFRTFQLSHLLMPFTAKQDITMHFNAEHINRNIHYYNAILEKYGSTGVTENILQNGLVLKNSAIYEADEYGQAILSKKVFNSARLVSTEFLLPKLSDDMSETPPNYVNKIFENYQNIVGAQFNRKNKDGTYNPFSFIAARSDAELHMDYTVRSFARTAFQRGLKTIDYPFAFMEEYAEGFPRAHDFIKKLRVGLGTNGDYTMSIRKSILEMGKNAIKIGGFGALTYAVTDHLVRNFSPQDSYFSNGIIAGLANIYGAAHIAYAENISDHFQQLKEKQEDIAPGSTKLTTMLGLPGTFALGGAMAAYGKFIYDASRNGFEAATTAHLEKKAFSIAGRNLFSGGRLGRWTKIGAAIGLGLELPFLPGALLTGKSSEELKQEYNEGKEVPVYKNRFWLGGGGEYNDGKVKYFRPSLVFLAKNDSNTKGQYGDYETAASVNPLLHPFDYLRNPYKSEELTSDQSPYPVWGMDTSYATFLGKAFEKTIGQIIKPDKLSPQFQEALKSGEITLDKDGNVIYNYKATDNEKSLIDSGMMTPYQSSTLDYDTESAKWSYNALKDFIGIKGFAISELEDMFGFDTSSLDNISLARSGQSNNLARNFSELELGGALGFGEAQRRYVPTNSGSIIDRANPLKNNMPDWLPNSPDSFYIDFLTGDPYSKVDMGFARLPGKGYLDLHPDAVDENGDYKDVYKYKILSDVALGSDEYYQYKNLEDSRAAKGLMDDAEYSIYVETQKQAERRSQNKVFYERKSDEELKNLGTLQSAMSTYWEFLTHDLSEPAYEKLSIIRPSSKFIHQRTAIEDYETTQVNTGDAGMWQKPFEHYISPFLSQVGSELGLERVPEKTEERREVDEYFDKLQYVKYRRLYKEAIADGDRKQAAEYKKRYQRTMEGSLASGLDNKYELINSFIALPKRERDYFASFVNTDNQEDRQKIISMVPESVGKLYNELWKRKDIISDAYDPKSGTVDQNKLKSEMVNLLQEENSELVENNKKEYDVYIHNKSLQAQGTFSEYLADIDSSSYIENTTGMPDQNFVGWDPRIDLNDVKLRTISLGKQDLFEYGFYDQDMDRLRRISAITNETQVTTQLSKIVNDTYKAKKVSEHLRFELIKNNINPTDIRVKQRYGDSRITINTRDDNG